MKQNKAMVVGRIESLWRYPVKSMHGEQLQEAFVGFAGIYGDRSYAFVSTGAPKGFPYLTGREKEEMVLYKPAYREGAQMLKPPNLEEADALAPGLTPVYPAHEQLTVDVLTPSGELLAVDDPRLAEMLRAGLRDRHELTLHCSHRAMTDCRPISLFSLQTVQQLSQETGADLDKRRFRANIYADLESGSGFGENEFVGRTLRIGAKAMVSVVDRDPRCKMITLDPENAEANPEVMRRLARNHDGKAGVYGAVLVEGSIRPGDPIEMVAS
jgi:uncharacterized protein YcbX